MIKKNAPILDKGPKNIVLSKTLFLICVKWSTGSVKLGWRK